MKKTKKKIQIIQNKYICFCLNSSKNSSYIWKRVSIDKLVTFSKRVNQCINTITYNSAHNTCAYSLNEIFEIALHSRIDTRNKFVELKNTSRKTGIGQKAISYIGCSTWNSLPDSVKKVACFNTCKHDVKKHYLTWMINNMYKCIDKSVCIYVCVSVGVCI